MSLKDPAQHIDYFSHFHSCPQDVPWWLTLMNPSVFTPACPRSPGIGYDCLWILSCQNNLLEVIRVLPSNIAFISSGDEAQNVVTLELKRQMCDVALRVLVLCGELMRKCVLAKPCNPLCDQEAWGLSVGGNDVDWVIPPGSYCTWKTPDVPYGICTWLNNGVFSAHAPLLPSWINDCVKNDVLYEKLASARSLKNNSNMKSNVLKTVFLHCYI